MLRESIFAGKIFHADTINEAWDRFKNLSLYNHDKTYIVIYDDTYNVHLFYEII